MRRTTLFLTEALDSDLQALARRRRQPVSGLVREALTEYVTRAKSEARALPGFVAAGRSGRSDVAEQHEQLLWREPHGAIPDEAPESGRKPAPSAPARRGRKRD